MSDFVVTGNCNFNPATNSFNLSAYTLNTLGSVQSAQCGISPIDNFMTALKVVLTINATARAAITGNSQTSNSGLNLNFWNNPLRIVHAQAEEHHDVNIPSDTKSVNAVYEFRREGAGWGVYLNNQKIGVNPGVALEIWIEGYANTQQTGGTASVEGTINLDVFGVTDNGNGTIPPIASGSTIGAGAVLAIGAFLLLSKKRRHK